MPAEQLRSFLDQHKVKYVRIQHSRAYTAQEVAASAHVPGKELAKTVIVKIGERMAMCILPADEKINLDALKDVVGEEDVSLADENDFVTRFPDCEIGAMPPFGNLYDMEVFVARDLAKSEEIVFNAGSHTELFRMAYRDFERLVQPKVIEIA